MKLTGIVFITIVLTGCGGSYAPGTTQGKDGLNGHSIAFSQESADINLCPAGGFVMSTGVDLNDDGLLQVNETKSISFICNGVNGVSASVSPFTPIDVVNPCGDNPGLIDEVFLRLANGKLVASMSDNSNGLNTRFSILSPGSYVTTDGDNCQFSVDAQGVITNESHHFN
jgi:hypothetical protein